jgi:hypothetical protein
VRISPGGTSRSPGRPSRQPTVWRGRRSSGGSLRSPDAAPGSTDRMARGGCSRSHHPCRSRRRGIRHPRRARRCRPVCRSAPRPLAERAGNQRSRHARHRPLPPDELGNPGRSPSNRHPPAHPVHHRGVRAERDHGSCRKLDHRQQRGKGLVPRERRSQTDSVTKFVITVAGHPATVITILLRSGVPPVVDVMKHQGHVRANDGEFE